MLLAAIWDKMDKAFFEVLANSLELSHRQERSHARAVLPEAGWQRLLGAYS